MGLTLTEKDHFKAKLRQLAEQLEGRLQRDDATWARDLRQVAEEKVHQSFDIDSLLVELQEAHAQVETALRNVGAVKRVIIARMTGKPEDSVDPDWSGSNRYNSPADYAQYPPQCRDIMRTQVAYELEELKSQHIVGKQLLLLEQSRGKYDDAIMTCGTHKQLADIWSQAQEAFRNINATNGGRVPRGVNMGARNVENE